MASLSRAPHERAQRGFAAGPAYVGFHEYDDLVAQRSHSHHWRVVDGRAEVVSTPFRYVWPSELDLMARLAGLELRDRWSDWERHPFTSDSTTHVSVWQKPASP